MNKLDVSNVQLDNFVVPCALNHSGTLGEIVVYRQVTERKIGNHTPILISQLCGTSLQHKYLGIHSSVSDCG